MLSRAGRALLKARRCWQEPLERGQAPAGEREPHAGAQRRVLEVVAEADGAATGRDSARGQRSGARADAAAWADRWYPGGMRRWLVGWVVLSGGCLDRNPVFIDPTEGDTVGEATSVPPATDSAATTSHPGVTEPSDTSSPASTTSMTSETTVPDANTDTEGTLNPTTSGGVDTTDTMPGSLCGNGVVEPGEECDDGNDYPYDACRETCMIAYCGDHVVQDWVEDCDDGMDGDDNDGCSDQCMGPVCGDGIVDFPEECDDANNKNNDGCENDCRWTRRIIFVTSKLYTGNMGGLLGADNECNELAQDAKNGPLPGFYRAWLSTSNESPNTRMFESDFRYARSDPDRTLIAHSWKDLIGGAEFGPINFNEHGELQPPTLNNLECGKTMVHTNTEASGDLFDTDTDCVGWTSTLGSSLVGSFAKGKTGWTEACMGETCKIWAPIYCVQQ